MFSFFCIRWDNTGTPHGLYWVQQKKESEEAIMKGYSTEHGYMGYVEGSYMLFACEDDYREYLEDTSL